jgi:dethiobiotin synthetase
MSKPLFITGIGTDIGKTIVSAVMVEHLKADYWKPVQAGDLDNSDTIKVRRLVNNTTSVFHPEAYRLTQPFSPHKAAALDGLEIDIHNIVAPETDNQLIIEGAGGLMVPLNNQHLVIDLIEHLDAEVILVSRNYLGSINHTLLSVDALINRGIAIKAILFNGNADEYTQNIIEIQTRHEIPFLYIPEMPEVNQQEVSKAAVNLTYSEL